jgi:hypothetical protein
MVSPRNVLSVRHKREQTRESKRGQKRGTFPRGLPQANRSLRVAQRLFAIPQPLHSLFIHRPGPYVNSFPMSANGDARTKSSW